MLHADSASPGVIFRVESCIDDPKFHRHIFRNPQFWEFGNLGMYIKMVGFFQDMAVLTPGDPASRVSLARIK